MSGAPRRRKSPPAIPLDAIAPNAEGDTTEPQAAPAERSAPAALPPPEPVRHRRATLVSPIPALLAEKMRLREAESDGTPLLMDPRVDVTSRQEEAERKSLLTADDDDYVVEVEP